MKRLIFMISATALFACNNCEPKEEFKTDLEEKSVYSEISINDKEDPFVDGQADPSLIDWIFDEVLQKEKAEIYDTDGSKLDKSGIDNIMNRIVRKATEDPEKPGSFIESVDTIKWTKNDVTTLIMKESWEIDKSTMKMKKHVEKIAPIVYLYDDNGNLKGRIMLFWIKMK